nr:TrbG/VirB9 family P-type conjugative transfer protein [Acidovorax sp. SUPP3334]
MKTFLKPVAATALIGWLGIGYAAGIPTPSANDSRIRTIQYHANDVTVIRAQRGTVTRIVLEQDERIEVPVVGLSSDCKSENDEWCISAIQGSNQIFVRPRDNATRNNMELHTSKRDYSFAFEVMDDSKISHGKRSDTEPFFRVVFEYPKPKPLAETMTAADRSAAVESLLQRVEIAAARPVPQQASSSYGLSPSQRLKAEGIQIRNTNYSKQVLKGGTDAEPTMVFDDGRFTYFEFTGAREIPAVFAQGSDGDQTRVNWHMHGDFVVVQRTAQKFTLRLGNAVVGIFNEAFDPTGISTPTSTVSPEVVRTIKGATE